MNGFSAGTYDRIDLYHPPTGSVPGYEEIEVLYSQGQIVAVIAHRRGEMVRSQPSSWTAGTSSKFFVVAVNPSTMFHAILGEGYKRVSSESASPQSPASHGRAQLSLDCPTCKIPLATGLGGFYCPQCHWIRP